MARFTLFIILFTQLSGCFLLQPQPIKEKDKGTAEVEENGKTTDVLVLSDDGDVVVAKFDADSLVSQKLNACGYSNL
jgi:hypothetical protein